MRRVQIVDRDVGWCQRLAAAFGPDWSKRISRTPAEALRQFHEFKPDIVLIGRFRWAQRLIDACSAGGIPILISPSPGSAESEDDLATIVGQVRALVPPPDTDHLQRKMTF